jgi:hypothetical protein
MKREGRGEPTLRVDEICDQTAATEVDTEQGPGIQLRVVTRIEDEDDNWDPKST